MQTSTGQKLVTIIVPAYNVENYIEECLQSIINQTYSNIEVIVVDDGSTDGTANIIKRMANSDTRIKPFFRENAGVSCARNFALDHASGTYIQFVDSDDTIIESAVATLVSAMESGDYDYVGCMYNRMDEEGNSVDEQYSFVCSSYEIDSFGAKASFIKDKLMPYQVGYEVWDKLFKADIIKINNILFNNECHIGEDLAFNINYIFYANHINCIDDRLYNYRIRTNSAMTSANDFAKNYSEHRAMAKGLKKEYIKWPMAKEDFDWLYSIIINHAYQGYTESEITNLLKKHAYLIVAHNNMESVKHLLKAIDDDRNDIYLHVDKKMNLLDKAEIESWVKHSNLFFAKRKDVRWGHISLTMCGIDLLKMATKKYNYHYYHLISGIDYPLKNQDEIHDFLETENSIFVSYHTDGVYGDNFMYKLKYYYPFMHFVERGIHEGPGKRKALLRRITNLQSRFLYWQKEHGVDRTKKYPDWTFYKGDNWWTIPDDFARYIVANKHRIKKIFAMTNAPDEIVLQTLALNNTQYKARVKNNSLRAIDWTRGTPYEYTQEDYPELAASDAFFARKISYVNEPILVNKLTEKIKGMSLPKVSANPLVSVVVPIYNVREYLQECLDSIKHQSYKNIQVLLVDDGSTDGSDSIVRQYAMEDDRFIYIHQDNQGLSSARNTGIAAATGEYVAFVDSDDWLDRDYINSMVQEAVSCNADMVVCGFEQNVNTNSITAFKNKSYLSKTKAMELLGNIFTPEYLLMIIACNKLIRRTIFDNINFQVGKIHEDEYIIHHIIDNADLIVTISDVLYHYRVREDSITGKVNTENLKHFDVLEAHLDRVACCKKQEYEDFYRLIVYSMFEELIQLMFRYSDDACKRLKLYRRFRWLMLRECIKNYSQLDNHQKKEYLIMIISPRLYRKRIERIMKSKNE